MNLKEKLIELLESKAGQAMTLVEMDQWAREADQAFRTYAPRVLHDLKFVLTQDHTGPSRLYCCFVQAGFVIAHRSAACIWAALESVDCDQIDEVRARVLEMFA